MKITVDEYIAQMNKFAEAQRVLCKDFILQMQLEGFDLDQMAETVELLVSGIEKAKDIIEAK